MVIQEETTCTEEKEEAGYRSPMWSILRALQKINKAKRLEGEAIMSAPPFFRWVGQRIGWFGAGRGNKTKSNACLKSMEKKSSQVSASKPNPKQERRRIRKEAKGSHFAGKRGGDRATSNAQ